MKTIQLPTPKQHASTPTPPSRAMLLIWILIASSALAGERSVTPRSLSGRARTGYFQRKADSLRKLINDSRGQVEELERALREKEGRLGDLDGTISRLQSEISQGGEQSRNTVGRISELERARTASQSAATGETQKLTQVAKESSKETGGLFYSVLNSIFGKKNKSELSKTTVQKVAPVARSLVLVADHHNEVDRLERELGDKRGIVERLKRERETTEREKFAAEELRSELAQGTASDREVVDQFVEAFQALPAEISTLEAKQATVLKRYETLLSTRDLGPRIDPRDLRLARLKKEMEIMGFNVPKDDISQDALATNLANLRFAIADGASRFSDFSETLAQSLVRRWVEKKRSFREFQEEVQNDWTQATLDTIVERSQLEKNRDKKWQSYATFVGAELTRGNLKVTATGDACIFIKRGGEVRPFPATSIEDFKTSDGKPRRPDFFLAKGEPEQVTTRDFQVQEGDEVFMLTDALAQWVFAEVKAKRDPFSVLSNFKNRNELRDFMRLAHDGLFEDRSELTEDDTTLIRFKVPRL